MVGEATQSDSRPSHGTVPPAVSFRDRTFLHVSHTYERRVRRVFCSMCSTSLVRVWATVAAVVFRDAGAVDDEAYLC